MSEYNFKTLENEMFKKWKSMNLLNLLQRKNKGGKPFFLLEGPPYANAKPHVGHLRNIYYKDLNQRYQFMMGRDVLFTAGYDTHGLPIENIVEKKMGFKNKKDILKFGLKNFARECKKLTSENMNLWKKPYNKYGCWIGWDAEPYLTYNNSYLESGWWAFKQIWDKKMVYKGTKPVHWCSHCETSSAGYEVTDSYQELTDPSVYVKFKLKNKNSSLLVYTTTPWTLPANVAIAVSGKDTYVEVKTPSGNLILAENRLELLKNKNIKYRVLNKFKGKTLKGLEYEPLFDNEVQNVVGQYPNSRKIYLSIPLLKERIAPKVAEKLGKKAGDIYEEFVTVESGTGLVHMAPGHGKTDNEFGKTLGLISVSPVNDEGKFTVDAGKYVGKYVKDADVAIISDLKKGEKLLFSEKIRHSYPVCWRCKTPLLFRLSTQWFFKTDKIRKKLLSENEKVNWMPGFAKDRMATWLSNYEDWNFTRQRFWGMPVPIWECNSCEHTIAIESKKELEQKLKKRLPEKYDLHNVRELRLKCKCGDYMSSIGDIFDVWFDSGVAPWAWMGAPHKNKKQFMKYFPVDRVNEGTDQIRGWFFSLLYTSVAVFGKAPYRTVSMPAFAVDAKGEKMSKSVGNVVWADEGIDNLGADLIRFYYSSNSAPYELSKFNINEVKRETYSTINTLWNLHNYLKTEYPVILNKHVTRPEDKWILSRLNNLIKNYHHAFENFEYQRMGRGIHDFIVNDLSRTYIQLVRERIDNKDSTVGYVMLNSIVNSIKLLAPISPFVSDKIYTNLKNYPAISEKSVHLERLPYANKSRIDNKLEKEFEILRNVITDVLALRDKMRRNLRWPIKKIAIISNKTLVLRNNLDLLKKQTNVTDISLMKDIDGIRYEIEIDYRSVGKKYGKLTSKIAKKIKSVPISELVSGYKTKIGSSYISLTKSDIKINAVLPEGAFGTANNDYLIILDKSEEGDMLISGFTRELIRKVQDHRKNIKLKKSEKINLKIASEVELNLNELQRKVNAKTIEIVNSLKKSEKMIIRGKKIEFSF